MEEPFYFDHGGHRLFGVRSVASGGGKDVGWVICQPFGEESQFSYRILQRFARCLGEAGYPVLRFDGRGYGESEGELEDSTLEGRVAETLAAVELAKGKLAVQKVGLLGLRLGGTVAAFAAEHRTELAGLLLWSPIISGATYCNELIRRRLFGDVVARRSGTTRAGLLELLEQRGWIETAGDIVTRTLWEELQGIDLVKQVGGFGGPILVATPEDRGEAHEAAKSLVECYGAGGAASGLLVAEGVPYWEDRFMNNWFLPTDLFRGTLDWIAETWS